MSLLLLQLPKDVLRLILTHYLDPLSSRVVRYVCKDLRQMCPVRHACSYTIWYMAGECVTNGTARQLEWLFRIYPKSMRRTTHTTTRDGYSILRWAARSGNKDTANALLLRNHQPDDFLLQYTIIHKQLPFLKWIVDSRQGAALWNKTNRKKPFVLCELAASSGCLETLRWLRQKGCQWDETVVIQAAKHPNKEMLAWAMEQGAPGPNCHDPGRLFWAEYSHPPDRVAARPIWI